MTEIHDVIRELREVTLRQTMLLHSISARIDTLERFTWNMLRYANQTKGIPRPEEYFDVPKPCPPWPDAPSEAHVG